MHDEASHEALAQFTPALAPFGQQMLANRTMAQTCHQTHSEQQEDYKKKAIQSDMHIGSMCLYKRGREHVQNSLDGDENDQI